MENKSFTENIHAFFDSNEPYPTHERPNNNLILTIVGTILGLCSPCCIGLIVGIIGIVYASQVNSKFDMSDFIGAEQSAKTAKILGFVALGLGVLGLLWNIIQVFLVGFENYIAQFQEILEQYKLI